ncbi:MAG: hypothetical protein E7256_16305 [Lachnospiraceae bacterium]|nr:hypothetical protein [Lachnospiraceae bacterium]
MNKRSRMLVVIGMLSGMLLLGGCKKQEVVKEVSPILVTMDGVSLYVGNGTIHDLLDAGFQITADEELKKVIKEDQYLDARTYFYDYYVSKEEEIYAKFSFINSQEQEIPYTDAIVYSVSFSFKDGVANLSPIYHTEHMLVDGVNLKGLTPEETDAAFKSKYETSEEVLAESGILLKKVYTNGNNKVMVQFDATTMTAESVIAEVDIQSFK